MSSISVILHTYLTYSLYLRADTKKQEFQIVALVQGLPGPAFLLAWSGQDHKMAIITGPFGCPVNILVCNKTRGGDAVTLVTSPRLMTIKQYILRQLPYLGGDVFLYPRICLFID